MNSPERSNSRYLNSKSIIEDSRNLPIDTTIHAKSAVNSPEKMKALKFFSSPDTKDKFIRLSVDLTKLN